MHRLIDAKGEEKKKKPYRYTEDPDAWRGASEAQAFPDLMYREGEGYSG